MEKIVFKFRVVRLNKDVSDERVIQEEKERIYNVLVQLEDYENVDFYHVKIEPETHTIYFRFTANPIA